MIAISCTVNSGLLQLIADSSTAVEQSVVGTKGNEGPWDCRRPKYRSLAEHLLNICKDSVLSSVATEHYAQRAAIEAGRSDSACPSELESVCSSGRSVGASLGDPCLLSGSLILCISLFKGTSNV